jgi:hypothetical protein
MSMRSIYPMGKGRGKSSIICPMHTIVTLPWVYPSKPQIYTSQVEQKHDKLGQKTPCDLQVFFKREEGK